MNPELFILAFNKVENMLKTDSDNKHIECFELSDSKTDIMLTHNLHFYLNVIVKEGFFFFDFMDGFGSRMFSIIDSRFCPYERIKNRIPRDLVTKEPFDARENLCIELKKSLLEGLVVYRKIIYKPLSDLYADPKY